jgi:hypothetical protein
MDCERVNGGIQRDAKADQIDHQEIIPHLRRIQRSAYPGQTCQRGRQVAESPMLGNIAYAIPYTNAFSHCPPFV